jgi:hypothetical protein
VGGDQNEVGLLLKIILFMLLAIFLTLPAIEFVLWIKRKFRRDD